MTSFLRRKQPALTPRAILLSGVGGAIAIALAVLLTRQSGLALLMAPFGASCVLLFSLPASPLAQPVNVLGGHLLSAAIGCAALAILPDAWWVAPLAVGAAIAAMAGLRITHPPAGANPLVILTAHAGPSFLIFPVLSGALLMVLIAWVYHRLTGTAYPAA